MPTTSWSKTRRSFPKATARRILRRDGKCMLQYEGCTGNADEADHITNHAEALRAGWEQQDIDDPTNGQAVCTPCHNIKTRAEIKRGQARARKNRPKNRPKPPHPGLIPPPDPPPTS